ncbi:MAG: multicopper oxidase domain-containing protein [Gemmatimonadaceae bacterium]
MHLHPSLALLALAALTASVNVTRFNSRRAPERIRADDNLRPDGTLRDGVLRLRLDTRMGMWHPDGDDAPGAAVPAFAEAGRRLQIPGPMIRVSAGTEVVVTVKNSVPDSVLTLHGLVTRPASAGSPSDTVQIAPGASREVRFRLDAPGTYYYWGTTTGRTFNARSREDAQLSGAIVVDEPGAGSRRDRVMVIGLWADTASAAARAQGRRRERTLLVVNGRSWPHTTRLSYAVGDTVRWRVINASADLHPMHLHGFYFSVDSRGNGRSDTTYAERDRDLVVTEKMLVGRTIAMSWVPERPGNWLFHCHIPSHFAARRPLGMSLDSAAPGSRPHHVDNHALKGMNGLVVGVHVAPARKSTRADKLASERDDSRRRLRLLVRPSAGGTEALPLYTYALHELGSPEPPQTPDSGVRTGPTIVLTRDMPVSITVVNRTPEQTAVHWHGMELESYFDGVAGFSGSGKRLSPIIAPADSFDVRFTPPRSGTFIYHTHINEPRQQPAGLAGALIVVDPDRPYDPATDIPVLITSPRDREDEARAVLLNGKLAPAALDVRVGVPYRLRLINITTGRAGMRMELRQDTTLVSWRLMAKDGAELPAARQVTRPASQPISIGETFDVEFTPAGAGEFRLEARTGAGVLLALVPLLAREPSKGSSP